MRVPSTSNPTPSGIRQGTMGGLGAMPNSTATPPHRVKPGGGMAVGDEVYLWLLVFIEVGVIALLRNHFRRYHGG